MKPKDPATVIDLSTARKNEQRIDNRQPIELDLEGAVASVIVQLVTQATAQAIQSDGSRIAVGAFLEGHGHQADERWKVHVTGMEFNEAEQSLKITGLELRPVK